MTALLLLIALEQAAAAVSAPAAAAPSAPIAAEAAPAEHVDPYSYKPSGRRDPFVTLIGTGEPRLPVKRSDGLAGLSSAEISVRGIVQGPAGLLAMVQGPDRKTYVVHPGEKLFDGTVKAISTQGLVIVQDVTDPLSTVKRREIRKALRSQEDSRQ
jgi:type IV pilus assembly protein PilP